MFYPLRHAQVWEGTWPPPTSCEAGPFAELSDRLPRAPHENVCRWSHPYNDEMAISIAGCFWSLSGNQKIVQIFLKITHIKEIFNISQEYRWVVIKYMGCQMLSIDTNWHTHIYIYICTHPIKHWGKKFNWWWTSSCTGGGFCRATHLLGGNEPRSSQPSGLHGLASLEKLYRLHFLLQLSLVCANSVFLTNVSEILDSKKHVFTNPLKTNM